VERLAKRGFLRAAVLLGGLVVCSLPAKAQGAITWYNSAWQYRNAISVGNSSGVALSNFQINVLLSSGFPFANAKVDGSDVRFTASDGATTIPFWVESWNPAQNSASVWVNVPSIPTAGTTIYIYYGNSSATTSSNGSATFDFFDDFSAASLNSTRWTASGGTWSIVSDTQQNGTMGNVLSGSTTARQILASSFSGTDYVLQVYGKQLNGRIWGVGTRVNTNNNLYSANLYDDLNSTNNLYLYSWVNDSTDAATTTLGSAAVGTVNASSWYQLMMKAHGSQIDVYKDGVLKVQGVDSSLTSGGIALYGEAGSVTEFNNVLVRKYAAVEPTMSVGPSTTQTSAAVVVGLSPASVLGGTSSQGTVTLSAAAPNGGAVITLSSSNSAVASVPASITIPAGNTTGTFAVSTTTVNAGTSVTLTGAYGGHSQSAILNVEILKTIGVTPANIILPAGNTQQYTATGTLGNNSTQNLTSNVTWSSSASGSAKINSAGLATAVAAGSTTISAVRQGVTGSTTLTISSATNISVSVSPKRGGLTIGQTLSLTATVANDSQNRGANWTGTGGSFSASTTASGVSTTYTAPLTAGVYTLTATSVSDGTKSASITIGVTDLPGVFTYHNDLSRDGSNTSEYALSTSNVTSGTFGKLFSCTVDGAIYAQPLWVANLTISGVKRNVVFVATQHESLYAFDADVNTTPCTPLWHANLIDAAHGGSSSESSVPSGIGGLVGAGDGDITPEVGITGTPVIDPASKTLYVVSKSVNASGTTFFQRLHAIDITTGSERSGSPVLIQATYPGTGDGGTTVTFNPRQQNQRAGLALVNGIIYIGWGSHEDATPFYGWIMAYNASTLSQTGVLNITPNFGYGGVWMGGGAFAADSNNNIYALTGNGTFDVTNATGPTNDYGDSFLKLTSGLSVLQYFTPSDQASDNANDQDLGSGGAAILLDQPTGPVQHLVIGGGKDGYLYLLNRDALGGYGDANAWQRFNFGNPIFTTGAFWNNTFFMAGVAGPLQAYSFNTSTGKFNTSNVSQSSATFGFPGSTPSVSSRGNTNGIVWALNNGSYCTNQSTGCGATVLHAYDSSNLATELWNSAALASDAAGNAVKFTVPTVTNGKVYVGTRGNNVGGATSSTTVPGELDVYGLLPN
jgi:Domain of unknown function (DUF2341)/Bacterial Ig-like domain (group 2)